MSKAEKPEHGKPDGEDRVSVRFQPGVREGIENASEVGSMNYIVNEAVNRFLKLGLKIERAKRGRPNLTEAERKRRDSERREQIESGQRRPRRKARRPILPSDKTRS